MKQRSFLRWIPILAAAVLGGPLIAAQETVGVPAETAGTPRIEFATSAHDFGRRDAGPDLKATFAFKNVGDGVLRIIRVKGG